MVKELMIVCPHCHYSTKVFLSRDAFVIILNCPSCSSPLMYFDHKIFILTESQLEAIKKRTRKNCMFEMINKNGDNRENSMQTLSKNNKSWRENYCESTNLLGKNKKSKSYFDFVDQKNFITEDDITNLRIDLALSKDVRDFIRKI